jgi:hypothetical protein
MTEEIRDGEWLVYEDGQVQPDSTYAVPEHEGVTDAGMDLTFPTLQKDATHPSPTPKYRGPEFESCTGTSM